MITNAITGPSDQAPAPAPRVRRRRRRSHRFVGFVAVAALLVGCGGSDGEVDDANEPEGEALVAPSAVEPELDVEPEPDLEVPGTEAEVVPLETHEVSLSRDPFEPVVPEPTTASVDASANTSDTDDTADDTSTDPDDDSDDSDDADDSDTDADGGACRGRYEVICDDEVVTVVEVSTGTSGERVAIVQVDTIRYEVRVDQTFAGEYEVRAIDDPCVTLRYGNEEFDVCRGDAGLK